MYLFLGNRCINVNTILDLFKELKSFDQFHKYSLECLRNNLNVVLFPQNRNLVFIFTQNINKQKFRD